MKKKMKKKESKPRQLSFFKELSPRKRRKKALCETTEYALFIRSSRDELLSWNRKKITESLVREANISYELADKISKEIEILVKNFKINHLSSSLIREMVNFKLLEYGQEEARRHYTRLGLPVKDTEYLLMYRNRENANIPHNPEATNLTLAEAIKKEFALTEVFSKDVADAHIIGDIHLHDLGMIDRPYCSGQSLEYVKKFGLNLTNALSLAKSARHPETLLAHMVKYSAALQGVFAGAIGWDAVNIFFAPYLVGLSDKELHQLAQMLIFEYSQQSVARGGQAIFSDINLYWEIPKHFENVEAIGPGGEYTGKKYKDYLKESQRFVFELFNVYKEGDASGRPFFFPKPLVHITERFFETPGWEDFLLHICDVAADKGNTYFVFDRGDTAKVSECCRLSFKLDERDFEDAKRPWKMRFCALQNITINLPRMAYYAGGNDDKLFRKLTETFELVVKAHKQKYDFIKKLLSLGDEGPLSLLTMKRDGEPYLRMHRITHLIGLLGLNELVQYHRGEELHQSQEALRFGLKVIAHLALLAKQASKREGMLFVLEQTPAESTAFRFAKLDLKYFYDKAYSVVKGRIDKEEVYYTNSTYLNISKAMNPIDRIKKEGLFHNMIEAGALTHIWLGEAHPSPSSLAELVKKIFYKTQNAQVAFSPEFTICNNCNRIGRGLQDRCSFCNSSNVDGITRVTGYFSKISSWNKGKLSELHDRFRTKTLI